MISSEQYGMKAAIKVHMLKMLITIKTMVIKSDAFKRAIKGDLGAAYKKYQCFFEVF